MTSDKERKLSLLIAVDQAMVEKSRKHIRDLANEEESLEDATRRAAKAMDVMNAETRDSITDLRQRIASLKLENDSLDRQIGLVTELSDKNERLNRTMRDRPDASKGADRFESAGDVSTGLSAAGALLPGAAGDAVRGLADLTGFIEQLPRLVNGVKGLAGAAPAAATGATQLAAASTAAGTAAAGAGISLGAVALAALPLAAALAVIAVMFKQIQKEAEEQKAVLQAAVAAQRRYYELIESGTSEEIRTELQAAEIRRAGAQRTLNDLQAVYGELSAFERLLPPAQELKNQIEALEGETRAVDVEIESLTNALGSSEVAARDAAAAHEEAAERIREATRQTISEVQKAADLRLQADTLAAEGTSEQVNERIEAIRRERNAINGQIEDLESLAGATEEGQAAIAELEAKLQQLRNEESLLTSEVLPLIRAREAETAAIERQRKAREDNRQTAEDVAAAQEAFNADLLKLDQKLKEDRLKLAQQTAERIKDIEARRDEQIAEALLDAQRNEEQAGRKLADSIAAVQQEAADREIDLRIESERRINEIIEDAAIERQRIEDDYADSTNDAVRERDATALKDAEKNRDKRLKENQEQLDRQIAQERRALEQRIQDGRRADEQRIRDLRQAHEIEIRDQRQALQQRLNDIRQAAANEITATRQKHQQELAELQNKFKQEQQARLAAFAKELQEITGKFVSINNITKEGLNKIAKQFEEFFKRVGKAATSSSGGGSSGGKPQSFSQGGEVARTGLAMLHGKPNKEEFVLNADTYSSLRGIMGGRFDQRALVAAVAGAGGSNITLGQGAVTIVTQSSDAAGIMAELEYKFPAMMANTLARLRGGNK